MIRIIAGALRGRQIRVPPNEALRPTGNKVRKAVFDILASRIEIEDIRLLDAYAGSGAVGIEALSRGASYAEFLETDRRTALELRETLDAFGLAGRSRVTSSLSPAESDFDVLFADPPYAVAAPPLAAAVVALRSEGWMILETAAEIPPNFADLTGVRSYRYGKTFLHLYQKAAL